MRIKHDFEHDNLSRKDLAKKYVKFLTDLRGNHTIALDAPWGSGKSKFIEFMREELNSEINKTKDLYIVYNNGTFKNRKNSAKSSSIIIDKNKLCLLLK